MGFLLVVQGAAGLVYHFVGWFGLWTVVHRLGFLAGHDVLANVVLVAIGFTVMIAGNRLAPDGHRTRQSTQPDDQNASADDE